MRGSGLRDGFELIAGAGLMYLLDPDQGARRRGLVRDKAVHALNRTADIVDKGTRDLGHRLDGIVARSRSMQRYEEISDERLEQRVRSKIGRVTSHAHAVEVVARDGSIVLRGPILAREVDGLIAAACSVPGVTAVDNQLEPHARADGIPSLQGSSRRSGQRFELLQESWSPAWRLIMAGVGGALTAYGIGRKGALGSIAGLTGATILVRDITNRPVKRLLGIGVGRRAVDFQKTITVHAPVEEVFAFWNDFTNLPRFMSHLRSIERLDENRWRWVAAGPAGVSVSWDAEVSSFIQDRVLGWRSVPGSAIGNAGIIHFEPTAEGTTRLDIKMSYNPPAGALGHVVASLFGVDPKHAMDEDLLRLKSLLEHGKTTVHGEEVAISRGQTQSQSQEKLTGNGEQARGGVEQSAR